MTSSDPAIEPLKLALHRPPPPETSIFEFSNALSAMMEEDPTTGTVARICHYLKNKHGCFNVMLLQKISLQTMTSALAELSLSSSYLNTIGVFLFDQGQTWEGGIMDIRLRRGRGGFRSLKLPSSKRGGADGKHELSDMCLPEGIFDDIDGLNDAVVLSQKQQRQVLGAIWQHCASMGILYGNKSYFLLWQNLLEARYPPLPEGKHW